MFFNVYSKRLLSCVLVVVFILSFNSCCNDAECTDVQGECFNVLVFSKTMGFRHKIIPDITKVIQDLGYRNNFGVEITENSKAFSDENLKRVDVVVFNNTTGDVLDDDQQEAFKRFIQSGKGYVGIHAATDTEYDWEWYGGLIGGAYFKSHPEIQEAVVNVENQDHLSTKMLPEEWKIYDELYNFRANPRDKVNVLAVLDETSYKGGEMGNDHPIIWHHIYDGGRIWFTGLGHTNEIVADPLYVEHLHQGIRWAADVSCLNDK